MDEFSDDPQNTKQDELATEEEGVGPLVGIIIILVLLAFGAFYFWGARLNNPSRNPPPYIIGNEGTSTP